MQESGISKEVEQRVFGTYFYVLGEFYNAYTGVEHHLVCCIKNTLSKEMRDEKNEWLINAVVGPMRMSQAKDTLKRIFRLQKVPAERKRLLDQLFAHLGEIEWLRNRLAHNTTQLRGSDAKHALFNFDFASAKEEEKSEVVVFMPIAVRAAAEDLVAIKGAVDDLVSMVHGTIPSSDLKLPAWQYKPSMLARHRLKSLDSQPR